MLIMRVHCDGIAVGGRCNGNPLQGKPAGAWKGVGKRGISSCFGQTPLDGMLSAISRVR